MASELLGWFGKKRITEIYQPTEVSGVCLFVFSFTKMTLFTRLKTIKHMKAQVVFKPIITFSVNVPENKKNSQKQSERHLKH